MSDQPVTRAEPPEGSTTMPPFVDENTTPRQLLWRSMIAHRKHMAAAVTLSALHQLGEMTVPIIVGRAIDDAVAGGDFVHLMSWIAALIVVFAILSYSFRYGSRIGWAAMNYVDHSLRMRVTDRILDPRGLGGDTRMPGELLSIASVDTTAVARSKAVLIYPVAQLIGIAMAAVVLLSISWPLGAAALLGAVLVVALSDKAGAPLSRRAEKQQEAGGKAAGQAADLIQGLRVIKGLGAEETAIARYTASSNTALAATLLANRAAAGLSASLSVIGGVFVIGIALVGGLQAVRGDMSVGDLIMVIGISQLLLEPIKSIGSFASVIWASSQASAKRVLAVLQAPYLLPVSSELRNIPLRSLALRIAQDHRVDIEPGGLTVISAPPTTVARLTDDLSLTTLPDPGSITVNGSDARTLIAAGACEVSQWRQTIMVVAHDAHLFDGTIAENIELGRGNGARTPGHRPCDDPATDEGIPGVHADTDVAAAIRAAGVDDVIEVQPQGINTPVGEAGTALSGGQRQRVVLARALIADPDILVLVDPTTAVDSVTETNIVRAVVPLRQGKTTVVFTHSPAWRSAAREFHGVVVDAEVTRGATQEMTQ